MYVYMDMAQFGSEKWGPSHTMGPCPLPPCPLPPAPTPCPCPLPLPPALGPHPLPPTPCPLPPAPCPLPLAPAPCPLLPTPCPLPLAPASHTDLTGLSATEHSIYTTFNHLYHHMFELPWLPWYFPLYRFTGDTIECECGSNNFCDGRHECFIITVAMTTPDGMRVEADLFQNLDALQRKQVGTI